MAFIYQANKAFNKLKTGFYSAMSRTKHFFNVLLDYIPFVHNRNLSLLENKLQNPSLFSSLKNFEYIVELLSIPSVRRDAARFNGDTHANIIKAAVVHRRFGYMVKLLEIPYIKDVAHRGGNYALNQAAFWCSAGDEAGMKDALIAVEELLKLPDVKESAHIPENDALRCILAHEYSPERNKLAAQLLGCDGVIANAHIENNNALQKAIKNGYCDIANKLLEIPNVIQENYVRQDNDVKQYIIQDNYVMQLYTKYCKRVNHANILQQLDAVKIDNVTDMTKWRCTAPRPKFNAS